MESYHDTCCIGCGELETCGNACRVSHDESECFEYEDCEECERFVVYRSPEDIARKLVKENAT